MMQVLLIAIASLTAVVVLYWLLTRKLNPPVLVAQVSIHPSGETQVVLKPSTASQHHLVGLLLAYAVKVNWLLRSEPLEMQLLFDTMLGEAVERWPQQPNSRLMNALPSVKRAKSLMTGQPWTASGADTFEVRLIQDRRGNPSVVNSLPKHLRATNLPWHYIVMLDHVLPLLSPSAHRACGQAFSKLYTIMYVHLADGTSPRVMIQLNDAAAACFQEIRPMLTAGAFT